MDRTELASCSSDKVPTQALMWTLPDWATKPAGKIQSSVLFIRTWVPLTQRSSIWPRYRTPLLMAGSFRWKTEFCFSLLKYCSGVAAVWYERQFRIDFKPTISFKTSILALLLNNNENSGRLLKAGEAGAYDSTQMDGNLVEYNQGLHRLVY